MGDFILSAQMLNVRHVSTNNYDLTLTVNVSIFFRGLTREFLLYKKQNFFGGYYSRILLSIDNNINLLVFLNFIL